MMSALVRALTSAEEEQGQNISDWPEEKLIQFRESHRNLLMEREKTQEQPKSTDSSNRVMWDKKVRPLVTEKYENFVVLRSYCQGMSRKEIEETTGLSDNEISNILKGRLRRKCVYITSDHHIFQYKNLPSLVRGVRDSGFACPSAGRVNRIINAENGNYTYYGSFKGKFIKATYVRRVVYIDKVTGKQFKGED